MFRNNKQAQQGGGTADGHIKLRRISLCQQQSENETGASSAVPSSGGPPRPKRGHPGTEGAPGCPTGGAECCCPGWWGLQVAWKPEAVDTEPPAHSMASSPVCKKTWHLCGGGAPEAELRTDRAHPSSRLYT